MAEEEEENPSPTLKSNSSNDNSYYRDNSNNYRRRGNNYNRGARVSRSNKQRDFQDGDDGDNAKGYIDNDWNEGRAVTQRALEHDEHDRRDRRRDHNQEPNPRTLSENIDRVTTSRRANVGGGLIGNALRGLKQNGPRAKPATPYTPAPPPEQLQSNDLRHQIIQKRQEDDTIVDTGNKNTAIKENNKE